MLTFKTQFSTTTFRCLKPLVVFSALLLSGCNPAFELVYCDYGYGGVKHGFYQTGANLLDQCLALDHLSNDDRAKYLQAKAWAHFNLENNQQALADQESAFALKPPAEQSEFINHAAYLRRLALYQESLLALRSAQKIDLQNGAPSMVTQYNLGWVLFELNRYDDAIEAFSIGIPQQPNYPFVYLRRGLTYLKQGNTTKAREDFEEFETLVDNKPVNFPPDLKQAVNELPSEFSRLKNL